MPMLKLCSNRPHPPSRNYIEPHPVAAASYSKHSNQGTYPNVVADSKSVEATSWGFNSPSRHHLKYQYPLWIQSFAALVSSLRSGCFGLASAFRYEIGYSAYPLYRQ
jgi:hypothetical protein